MQTTPKGFRLHIGIFGRRNVGKSSLLNTLTHQQISIVSEQAGTTTDPVEKPMELLPIGPVLFIDTAGIDDAGALGELRIAKTKEVFDRTEIGIVVSTEAQDGGAFGDFELGIVNELKRRNIPIIFVLNKTDLGGAIPQTVEKIQDLGIPFVPFSVTAGKGLAELRQTLFDSIPEEFLSPPPIISDLVHPGDMVVLVVPVDKEAPKGRLILPQVQTIRDILDAQQACVVVQDKQLKDVIGRINPKPVLVVTDSQAFEKVAADTPPDVMMTSFSILFARQKGDLLTMAEGAKTIGKLKPGSKVLIAESCTHHPIEEDIGTLKIPNWMEKFLGGKADFTWVRGHDFPADEKLNEFELVIHCGACMWNRREMVSRILRCNDAGVPITNYGLAIAYMLGILDRALVPFLENKNG